MRMKLGAHSESLALTIYIRCPAEGGMVRRAGRYERLVKRRCGAEVVDGAEQAANKGVGLTDTMSPALHIYIG